MIKSIIKNLLFVGFIFFGVNSFVSAVCNPGQGVFSGGGGAGKFLVGIQNPSNIAGGTSLSVGVLNKGQLITSQGGIEKAIFSPLSSQSNQIILFFNNNKPYLYFNYGGSLNQGYFKYMTFCDEITEDTSLIVPNCSTSEIDVSVISNFLSNVNLGEDYYGWYFYPPNQLRFGFSSKSLGKSLWFMYLEGFIDCPLIDSNNYSNLSFSNISSDIIGNSPGLNGGGSEGSNNDILITSACSKQKALNYYENNGYTKKLCYGGYDDFTVWDGSPTGLLPYYGSGLDIEEIWFQTANYYQGGLTGNSQSYSAWFGYRRQMYSTYKRGGYSTNPFVDTPLVMFGLFSAVDTYGSNYNSNEILEYCDLKLYTADYNVDYTGINYNNVCTSPISFLDNYINGSGYNGTGFIGINTNEILSVSGISLSGDLLTGSNSSYFEGSNFILDFSQKLEDNFGDILNNSYGQGILPIYITFALLGLILFRFMSH